MKTLLTFAAALVFSVPAFSQTAAIRGYCEQGANKVATSGLQSSTTVQQSFPRCTVNVYLTGTLTHATIYDTSTSHALANPFTANADGSWIFWAATSGIYDVTMTGGTAPNIFPAPVTLAAISLASGGGGSGCSAVGPGGYALLSDGNGGCILSNSDYGVTFPFSWTFVGDVMSTGGAGEGGFSFNATDSNTSVNAPVNMQWLLRDNGANNGGANFNASLRSFGVRAANYQIVSTARTGDHSGWFEFDSSAGQSGSGGSGPFNNWFGIYLNNWGGNSSANFDMEAVSNIPGVSGGADFLIDLQGTTGTTNAANFDLDTHGVSDDSGNVTIDTSDNFGNGGNFNVRTNAAINMLAGVGDGSSAPSAISLLADKEIAIHGYSGSVPIQAGHGNSTDTFTLSLEGNTVTANADNGNLNLSQHGTGEMDVFAQGQIAILTNSHFALASSDITLPAAGASQLYITNSEGNITTSPGPVTFASLATCNGGLEGHTAPVTDSNTATWGANIAGGGSNHVLAYCNSANWTVAAK